MPTAEELLVAIRSEGVSETRQELDGVSQQMEETADQAGSSAEELEGFSNRFEGAITAAVSALAVGAAGLASQVPVLGELFSGVAAVVGAVAFQMDQVLRPVLSPITKAFFGLSDAIFNLDGAAGDAVGIIGSIITAIVGIGGTIAAVAVQIFGFSTVWGAVSSAVGTAISAIVGFIGGIPLAIAAAIAAIVGFVIAYLTNFKGIRDKTNEIIGNIVDFIMNGINFFAENGLSAISKFVKGVISFFSNLGSNIFEVLSDIASNAFEAGKNIVTNLIDGMKNILSGDSEIGEMLGLDSIETPSTDELSFDGVDTDNLGVSKDKFKFDSESFESDISGRSISQEQFMSNNSFTLDGRKMTEDTGRYRSDASLRRGL